MGVGVSVAVHFALTFQIIKRRESYFFIHHDERESTGNKPTVMETPTPMRSILARLNLN
jgi:hypothetical protein